MTALLLSHTPAWASDEPMDSEASTVEAAGDVDSPAPSAKPSVGLPTDTAEKPGISAPEVLPATETIPAVPDETSAASNQTEPTPGQGKRTGFSTSLGFALATCLPDGNSDCTNTYPGGSVSSSMEVRFWYLGIALEFDYGFHFVGGEGSENVSSTTMHLTPVLKGYYPMAPWEFFLGAGLGYSAITVTEDASESLAGWSSLWQGVKLTGGAWYDLQPHGFPEGFTLDLAAHLFLNYGGTRCTEYAGSGPCLSEADLKPAQRDVANHLQLGTALRYTFEVSPSQKG